MTVISGQASTVLLSALQHYLYCPRQCGLIHLEQVWRENRLTAEGRNLHESADSGKLVRRRDLRTATGLLLASRALGISGKADMVEFHRKGKVWVPFPVEYKRGRAKNHEADRVQLCAQALCLEETTGQDVPAGALFYGQTRRRLDVVFDADLRQLTITTIKAVRSLLDSGILPGFPEEKSRCAQCSLRPDCLPEVPADRATSYLLSLCEDA